MAKLVDNLIRVSLGVLLILVVWALGGYLGGLLWPQDASLNKIETLSSKVGSSVAIILASCILRRFIYGSFGWALTCLAATEFVVLLIIMFVYGWSLTAFDIAIYGRWLWKLTWNVVIAFLIGILIGQLWKKWRSQ